MHSALLNNTNSDLLASFPIKVINEYFERYSLFILYFPKYSIALTLYCLEKTFIDNLNAENNYSEKDKSLFSFCVLRTEVKLERFSF